MSLLSAEPPGGVQSLAELFAIACVLEEEAAARYRELAVRMREHGAPSAAAVFERLAEIEREHGARVIHWAERQGGKAPDMADIRWHVPQTFDDEGASDIAGSRLVTPYRALSMAVRNEERAFAFWSYVAARTEEASLRDVAEAMAREELEHVSLLRRERRRAYHSAGGEGAGGRLAPGDALAEAADLEARLAGQLDNLRLRDAPEAQARIRELAGQSWLMAGVSAAPGLPQPGGTRPDDSAGIPDETLAAAEYLVERYLETADRATDEQTMNRAQSLARKAITRLASLRAMTGKGPGTGGRSSAGV